MTRITAMILVLFASVASAHDRREWSPPAPIPVVKMETISLASIAKEANISPEDLISYYNRLSPADFKYAASISEATGDKVTNSCWSAWHNLLSKQQEALKEPGGLLDRMFARFWKWVTRQEEPSSFITGSERIYGLIVALQPDGELFKGCSKTADIAKKSLARYVGTIIVGKDYVGVVP